MKFMVAGLLTLLLPLLFAANPVLAELLPLPIPISEGARYPLSAHGRDDPSFRQRCHQLKFQTAARYPQFFDRIRTDQEN